MLRVLDSSLPAVNLAALDDPENEELLLECIADSVGVDRRWVIPDWLAVAEDYEVVHLTVNGYLTTSGRALAVDTGSSTFLAGWNPDMSYWLSDVLEAAGSPTLWVSEEHHPERRWRLADESVP